MQHDGDATVVVATILSDIGPTGVQAHFREFLQYLEEQGRSAILVTPFRNSKLTVYPVFAVRKLLDPISGDASVWWYRHWHTAFLRRALQRRLSKMGDCVVYAQCPLSAHAAIQARVNGGQRVVMAVHFNHSQADEWCDKGRIGRDGWMAQSIRAFESRILPSLDGIVYVSRYMKGHLEKRIGSLHAVPSDVIPNFCRSPAGLDRRCPPTDVICVGTLERRKNQRFLLDVLAYTTSRGKSYTLTLVGDGPDRTELKGRARDLGIQDCVRFLGNHPRAIELMSSARLYAHAAILENLPLAIIEAMACGLPVLAPRLGGIPDLIDEGKEGYFWPLDDVARAGDLLIRTLENVTELQTLSAAARRRFESEFAASRVAARLLGFLVPGTRRASGAS